MGAIPITVGSANADAGADASAGAGNGSPNGEQLAEPVSVDERKIWSGL